VSALETAGVIPAGTGSHREPSLIDFSSCAGPAACLPIFRTSLSAAKRSHPVRSRPQAKPRASTQRRPAQRRGPQSRRSTTCRLPPLAALAHIALPCCDTEHRATSAVREPAALFSQTMQSKAHASSVRGPAGAEHEVKNRRVFPESRVRETKGDGQEAPH